MNFFICKIKVKRKGVSVDGLVYVRFVKENITFHQNLNLFVFLSLAPNTGQSKFTSNFQLEMINIIVIIKIIIITFIIVSLKIIMVDL